MIRLASANALHFTHAGTPAQRQSTHAGVYRTSAEGAMPFQSVPETAEIDILYTLNGKLVQNVFYGRFPGGYNQTELDVLAVRIDTRVQANWLLQQPQEAVYQRVEVRGLEDENDLLSTFTTGPTVGSQIVDTLPNNVTFAIKQNSGLSGRSARGRMYWIGIPRDRLDPADENNLLQAYVSAVLLAVGAIRTGIDTLPGWDAVLVSRVTGGVARPFGITFPWISEVNVDLRVDSQRGRLP